MIQAGLRSRLEGRTVEKPDARPRLSSLVSHNWLSMLIEEFGNGSFAILDEYFGYRSARGREPRDSKVKPESLRLQERKKAKEKSTKTAQRAATQSGRRAKSSKDERERQNGK
ncbi:hypothetical protein CIHG_06518 [Coccidioides immitis H538.4]|uniref:Uncharacterized protein n=1 Tax=Coccidioides immitis H538.4 TaxID=396776 RepID=A0A0J8RWT0_COCIT|nr:hypothetical protein CIHG_06518 [Coccidioides immitis H538.4]